MANTTDSKKVMDYFSKREATREDSYKDSYNKYLDKKKEGGPCMTCGKKKK